MNPLQYHICPVNRWGYTWVSSLPPLPNFKEKITNSWTSSGPFRPFNFPTERVHGPFRKWHKPTNDHNGHVTTWPVHRRTWSLIWIILCSMYMFSKCPVYSYLLGPTAHELVSDKEQKSFCITWPNVEYKKNNIRNLFFITFFSRTSKIRWLI